MRTLRLLLSYDGTGFSGFQVQPDRRTVQGVLEGALSELRGEPVRVKGAGRTDAGVHALGQVVSLEWPDDFTPDAVLDGLTGRLPQDAGVLDAAWAPDGFDARRSARSRSYVYLVWNHRSRHPIFDRYVLRQPKPLDAVRLAEALEVVRGTHDFTSFARLRPDQDPQRTVHDVGVDVDGPMIRIRIIAASFLHQMARSIVGSALEVAAGRRTLAWMREVLLAGDRAAAGPVAKPRGLALVDVDHEGVAWPRRPPVPWPWSGEVRTTFPTEGTGPRRAIGGAG